MLAHEIRDAVVPYFLKKRMAIHAEVGLCRRGRYRADLLALDMRGNLTIVEIKGSVQDFRRDKKWQNYLKFSNRLYFAFNQITYDKVKESVPKGIGIFVIRKFHNKGTGKTRYTVSVKQKSQYRTLKQDVQFNLAVRLAFRTADFNRYKRHKG